MSLKLDSKEINIKIAKYLKKEREDKKLTMRALADTLETPHSFVGKIEKRNRRVDVGEFIIYCRAMGKSPITALTEIIKL